jgi:hypothetical protein
MVFCRINHTVRAATIGATNGEKTDIWQFRASKAAEKLTQATAIPTNQRAIKVRAKMNEERLQTK